MKAAPASALILLSLLWLGGEMFRGFGQTVSLTDNGSSVTLANGVVSATFTKSNGNCTDLRLAGGANLLANGGKFYFDANGSTNGGGSAYVNFTPEAYGVVTNTPEQAEIVLTDTNLTGFSAELHYLMRVGDRGFYTYIVWRHGFGNPTAMLEQSRMVLRCDPGVFTLAYASVSKMGQMIEPLLLKTNPVIMDATYALPLVSSYTNATGFTEDGRPVYTKYDWCDYMENHTIEGLTSDVVGLWLLFGSVEYFNGGPTKANLLLHGTDTTPLLLWDFHAQHFGGAKIYKSAGETWDKIVGPCFVYVNSGTNSGELWQEARQRAAIEQAAWPYAWMSQSNYPVARGTVSGRLHIVGQSAGNALLVLAQPGTNWQLQSEGYQFWTRADDLGDFSIAKVRPGSYSLFARVPGAVGEFELKDVQVASGQTNHLGVLTWSAPRRQHRLWRIGSPDLSASEFRFGDEMRQFGLWWRYMEEQGTNDLVYRIGTSTPASWYYAQSVVALDDGTWFSPNWRVEFILTNLPPSPAVLTIDLAGAVGGTLFTTVNGTSLDNIVPWNDASIYRSATRSGTCRHHELTFDPNLLHLGTNVVSFTLSKPSPWTNSATVKPVSPNRGVMYDCVQLEAGPLATPEQLRFVEVRHAASGVALSAAGGLPLATYYLLGSTDAALPLSDWTPITTGEFDGEGAFSIALDAPTGLSRQFYLIAIP